MNCFCTDASSSITQTLLLPTQNPQEELMTLGESLLPLLLLLLRLPMGQGWLCAQPDLHSAGKSNNPLTHEQSSIMGDRESIAMR